LWLKVNVVANSPIRVPRNDLLELVEVRGGMDKADDWIAERAEVGDVLVTSDIPLADRRLSRGARVIDPTGREFTGGSIGHSLATRALLDVLRQAGEVTGGPAPFAKADRSRFLTRLDEAVHAARRDTKAGERT
jgi:uncharacterized protein YaiI (UPF0178 family)